MVYCHVTIALVDEALDQARLQSAVNYAPLPLKRANLSDIILFQTGEQYSQFRSFWKNSESKSAAT